MRSLLVSSLLLCTAACAAPVGFEQFCFKCHDATQAEGDLDLEDFVAKDIGVAQVARLEDIMLRIEEGDMPPKKSRKQPNDAERAEMIAWTRVQIETMAKAAMDDPGVVMMARLTRHEYRNVIRDLSGGIVLKAGELLPNEGGAGEGFSNVGEAQGMSMAQFEKYLEAAKGALKHLRVSPHDGLVWSTVPREPVEDAKAQIKEACDDIIAWHVAQQQKWGRDHREDLQQRLGFNDAAYLEAAWHRRHGRDFVLKDQAGTTVPLAAVVLEKWQAILTAKEPQEPFVSWAKAWQALNPETKDIRQRCIEIVAGKAAEKPTGLPPEGYAPPYEISFHEAITEVVGAATERGVWPFRIAIGDAKELFFVVTDAGDGSRGESATWRKGRFQFADGTAKPWQEVTQVFGANSGKPFPFGKHFEDGRKLSPDSIGVKPPGALKIAVPPGATLFELELALDPQSVGKSSVQAIVLREKPKSQSYIPGRMVFGGKKSDAREAKQDAQAKELERALRKRNISEANVTKIGLNAERNIFSSWSRTPLEAIGGPWPDHPADVEEPLAPYHLTTAQVRRNATPEDLAELHELENRLFALTQPFPEEMKFVTDFARRAWRRDLIPQEIDRLAQLYREALQPNVSFDSAMKAPLLAVLMSPEFLYRSFDWQSYTTEPSFLEGEASQVPHNQGLIEALSLEVDSPSGGMQDTIMTRVEGTRKRGRPFLKIKHGSAVVPIYKGRVRKWDCYTVAYHMNGKRVRRNFGSLEKAKAEAQLMARKIQEGKSSCNDLTSAQRENHLAAERLVAPFKMPLVAAVEEYTRCRQLLGEVPLMMAIQEFVRRNRGVQLGVKVPDLIDEFVKAKAEDNLSRIYRFQLSGSVKRFATAFPGEILPIKSCDIDRWLRSLNHPPVTRNSLHRCIKVFFSFAKSRGYLPQSEATAAELVPIAKEGETKTEIFQPAEMIKLLAAASSEELALLAIGGFAGLRMAEIKRLDWKAVDLDRRIITLRADQAKTASRRIVPISENLAAWIEPLPREGKVVGKVAPDLTKLAEKLGMEWPRNALRHSYISYRLAVVKDAAKVALEAGNSPDIIFKHYRELVTEPEAKEWFAIMPAKGWSPPEPKKPKATPRRPRKLVDAILG